MFTNKDVEYRTIFVINCIKDKNLRVSNGELLLEEVEEKKTLTKLPFQKILALFVIGHIHITTPLIEKCKKFNVALVVMKPSLRPVFYWSNSAEANYLLRQKQYQLEKENIIIAKWIVYNKVCNQLKLLQKSRKTDALTIEAKTICNKALSDWLGQLHLAPSGLSYHLAEKQGCMVYNVHRLILHLIPPALWSSGTYSCRIGVGKSLTNGIDG